MAGIGEDALMGLSALLLARAHYLATWRGHGARWSKAAVWTSTALAGFLWWVRL